MAERDWSEKVESVLKGLSVFAVPVLLGLAGYIANGHIETQKQALEQDKLTQQTSLEREKLNQQMFSRATEVVFFAKEQEHVFGRDTSLESRRLYRAHWLDLYNHFAPIKLNEDFIAIVMEQDTRPQGKKLVEADKKPLGEINPNGDGWVAIGRIPNTRDTDLNFVLSKDAINKDDTVKAGTMVRARWSMNLRYNLDNTEDHRPDSEKLNPVVGLMAAGECAKVLDSRAKIRGQTWAKIDVVACDASVSAQLPSPPRG